MPRETPLFDISPPISGEHQFAAYNEDGKTVPKYNQQLFLSNGSDSKI